MLYVIDEPFLTILVLYEYLHVVVARGCALYRSQVALANYEKRFMDSNQGSKAEGQTHIHTTQATQKSTTTK